MLAELQAFLVKCISPDLICCDAQFLLHQAFRGESVIVKTQRIEDIFPLHTSVSGDQVSMCIGIYMSQMKQPGYSGWRRINRKHWGFCLPVEMINASLPPNRLQTCFGLCWSIIFGEGHSQLLKIKTLSSKRGRKGVTSVVPPQFAGCCHPDALITPTIIRVLL